MNGCYYKMGCGMTDLKAELKEIVELVELVPEPLKLTCFEMLFKELLNKTRTPVEAEPHKLKGKKAEQANATDDEHDPLAAEKKLDQQVSSQSDINLSEIHLKSKKFLERHQITAEQLNNLFYKEGEKFKPLFENFKTTKMSEMQIRIALLQAFQASLDDGEFVTTVEAVREECKARKAYDLANFTTIFKTNSTLFDFGTWSKDVVDLRLSEEGRKQLAVVAKAML
jgi:hypothetical protein